jgi:hypothetical protein
VLTTGTTYKPSITANSIYYIKDASSISVTAGPSSTSNTLLSPTNGGSIGVLFTASKAFTITEMKVAPYIYSMPGTVSVTFTLSKDGQLLGTYTSNTVNATATQSAAPFSLYTIAFSPAINIPSAGSYELKPSTGSSLAWYQSGADFTKYDATGVIDVTDDTRTDNAVSFPGIFDIKVQAGSTCARAMAFANIDANLAKCKLTNAIESLEDINTTIVIYPNPSTSNFTLKGIEDAEVKVFDNLGKEVLHTSSVTFGSNLLTGMYHVLVSKDGIVLRSINIIKQ